MGKAGPFLKETLSALIVLCLAPFLLSAVPRSFYASPQKKVRDGRKTKVLCSAFMAYRGMRIAVREKSRLACGPLPPPPLPLSRPPLSGSNCGRAPLLADCSASWPMTETDWKTERVVLETGQEALSPRRRDIAIRPRDFSSFFFCQAENKLSSPHCLSLLKSSPRTTLSVVLSFPVFWQPIAITRKQRRSTQIRTTEGRCERGTERRREDEDRAEKAGFLPHSGPHTLHNICTDRKEHGSDDDDHLEEN